MAPKPKDTDDCDGSCTTLDSSGNDSEALLVPTPVKEESLRNEENEDVPDSPATRTLNSLSQSHFIAKKEMNNENEPVSPHFAKKAKSIKHHLPWKQARLNGSDKTCSSQEMCQPGEAQPVGTSKSSTLTIDRGFPCAPEESIPTMYKHSTSEIVTKLSESRLNEVGKDSDLKISAQEKEIHSRPIHDYIITKPGKLGVVISKRLIGSQEYCVIGKVRTDSICFGLLQEGDILCSNRDSTKGFMTYDMVHTLAETRPVCISVARRATLTPITSGNGVQPNVTASSPNSSDTVTMRAGAASLPSTQMLAEALLSLDRNNEPNDLHDGFSSRKKSKTSKDSQEPSNDATISPANTFDGIVQRCGFPLQLNPFDTSSIPILFCKPCQKNSTTESSNHHRRCPKSPKFVKERFLDMIHGYNTKCLGCLEEFRYGGVKTKKHAPTCSRQTQQKPQIRKLKEKPRQPLLSQGKEDFNSRKETWAKFVEPPDDSSISDDNSGSRCDSESEMSLPDVLNSYDIRSNWIPYCDACNVDDENQPQKLITARRRRYHHHEKCPQNPKCDIVRFQKMIDGYNNGCQECKLEYESGNEKPAKYCYYSPFCTIHNNISKKKGKESQMNIPDNRTPTENTKLSEVKALSKNHQGHHQAINQKLIKGIEIGCESCQYEMDRGKKARHLRHHINCERSSMHRPKLSPSSINKHQEAFTMENRIEEKKAKHSPSQFKKRKLSPVKLQSSIRKTTFDREKNKSFDHAMYLSRLSTADKLKLGVKMGCRSCIHEQKTGIKNRHDDHCVRSKSFQSEDVLKAISSSDALYAFMLEKSQLEKGQLCQSNLLDVEIAADDDKELDPRKQTFNLTKDEKLKMGVKMGCKSCIREMKTGRKSKHDKHCFRSASFRPKSSMNISGRSSFDSPGNEKVKESSDSQRSSISTDTIQRGKNDKDAYHLNVIRGCNSSYQKEKVKFLDASVDITRVVFPFCRVCNHTHQIGPVSAHHVLCPQHPQFTNSGAIKKIERMRFGLKHDCPACEIEYERGSLSDKAVRHNLACKGNYTSHPVSDDVSHNMRKKQVKPNTKEKANILKSSPVMRKRSFSHTAKSVTPDIRREGLSRREEGFQPVNRVLKPIWKSCLNPWGEFGLYEGDVVISSIGLSHHEALLNDERFTVDPFKSKPSYKATHYSPGEGTHTLKLTRDPLACVPWGIQVERHDFGGACLVYSVDENSSAAQASYVGSSVCSPLLIHDMILAVNGKDVGGMTRAGFDIEMETSGAEMTITISRYRFPSNVDMQIVDMQNNVWAALEQSLEDKRNLGWCELDFTSKVEQVDDEPIIHLHKEEYSRYQSEHNGTHTVARDLVIDHQDLNRFAIHSQSDELLDDTSDACASATSSRSEEVLDDGLDENGNPCAGCVCGEIHEPPTVVFWIQCDSCDCWYNVSQNCVGFDEKAAESISQWACRACPGQKSR